MGKSRALTNTRHISSDVSRCTRHRESHHMKKKLKRQSLKQERDRLCRPPPLAQQNLQQRSQRNLQLRIKRRSRSKKKRPRRKPRLRQKRSRRKKRGSTRRKKPRLRQQK